MEDWRGEHNEERPKKILGGLTSEVLEDDELLLGKAMHEDVLGLPKGKKP